VYPPYNVTQYTFNLLCIGSITLPMMVCNYVEYGLHALPKRVKAWERNHA
jgi:hypothetical protein